jgi:hypothetical protein
LAFVFLLHGIPPRMAPRNGLRAAIRPQGEPMRLAETSPLVKGWAPEFRSAAAG